MSHIKHVRHEAERAASEQQFQLLVEGVKDYAIFMLDPQGRITTWNSGAERIKGYHAEEIIGEHFSRFYTEEAEAVEGPGHETILLVEDDRDVRAYLVEVLRDLNYRVLSAHDAVSALGLIKEGDIRIDLLLTDVVLPGMNGPQLAEQARNRRPGLKVLFTTGYSRNAIVHQGRLDPGVAMIQKPITQEGLAARIRDLLDARLHDPDDRD